MGGPDDLEMSGVKLKTVKARWCNKHNVKIAYLWVIFAMIENLYLLPVLLKWTMQILSLKSCWDDIRWAKLGLRLFYIQDMAKVITPKLANSLQLWGFKFKILIQIRWKLTDMRGFKYEKSKNDVKNFLRHLHIVWVWVHHYAINTSVISCNWRTFRNFPFQITPVKFDDETEMLNELKSNLPNNTKGGNSFCLIKE